MKAAILLAELLVVCTAIRYHAVAAAGPPVLRIQCDGQSVVITWEGGGLLESASEIRGPWAFVPAATSPYRVVVPSVATFYRVQQVHTLTVTRAGDGAGTVRSSPAGILCGADCTETLPAGQTVTLQATPDEGSTFAGWSGDCGGTGDCVVTLDRARTVTATFAPAPGVNPFVNGDFEQGPLVGWEQSPGKVIFTAENLGGAQPYSGRYAAFLGMDEDGRRQVQLGQRITLPNRQPLYLNFAAWLYSKELCDVPWYDQITLYLNGQVAFQDSQVCQGSGTDGWLRYGVDVSVLAGQSVAVVFEIYSSDGLWSALLLDDLAISEQAWGE